MLCRVVLQPRDGLIDMPVHVDGYYEQDWADLWIVDLRSWPRKNLRSRAAHFLLELV